MEVINVTEQLGGMNFNRPMTAMSSKKTLGSTCPVIIKHEFPNEQRHYIDNVGQEMSSTKKRFIYDRPNTAKIQQNSLAQQNNNQGMKRSQSGLGLQVPNSANGMKRNSASAISQSSYQINSADLYNKLLDGQKIKKESRFVIKPARKLNTFQIHSALFKIKKQKEELDYKIRELEDLKSNFNEMDFYLIANTGAVDYMFNAGAMSQATFQQNHQGSQGDSAELEQQSDNQIPSLMNINSQSESSLKKDAIVFNKKNELQSKKLGSSQLTFKQARPQTSIPKVNGSKANNNKQVRAATAKTNSRDQIEMLRGESRDESRDKGIDLEILGNCMRIFQDEERVQVLEWGRNIENPDQVKQGIEQIGQNLPTINRLLSAKNVNAPLNPAFGEIKEEEEQEDLQFQPFESLQKQFYEQNYQQYLTADNPLEQTNNIQTNSPYANLEDQKQLRIGDLQYLPAGFPQHYASTQDGSIQGVLSPHSPDIMMQSPQSVIGGQQNMQSQNQYGIYPSFQKRQQKKNHSKRIHSATAQHGLFRPQSSSINSAINQNWFSQQSNVQQARPLTANSSAKFFSKASHHALMSYGPVQVVKEQITRNFDHLEILAESRSQERQKRQKEKEKIENKMDWLKLKVSGTRLPITTDTFGDLQFKAKQALANIHQIQQVDLNGESQHNYFQNSLPNSESHYFSAPKQFNVKGAHLNRPSSQGQLQVQQNSNNIPQQFQQAINYQNFQNLHSASDNANSQENSQPNRAAIDLNQMQKDQSIKFMRPSTAKPGSSQSSRLAQKNVKQGNIPQSNNPYQNINVPFSESIAFKLNQQQSNPITSENLSGVVFANASVNFNILQSNQTGDNNQNQGQEQQWQTSFATPNQDNLQNMQMVSSNTGDLVYESSGNVQQTLSPTNSLQNPPVLQAYQAVEQQEFQFEAIEQENINQQNDDLTIKKKGRPQTAVKK